jgi:hypothetical protein
MTLDEFPGVVVGRSRAGQVNLTDFIGRVPIDRSERRGQYLVGLGMDRRV